MFDFIPRARDRALLIFADWKLRDNVNSDYLFCTVGSFATSSRYVQLNFAFTLQLNVAKSHLLFFYYSHETNLHETSPISVCPRLFAKTSHLVDYISIYS